jgi:hypothetical protein
MPFLAFAVIWLTNAKDEGIEIPMVTTHGTYYFGWESSFYKPAVSFSINKSDVVTSVSQSLKEDTYKLFNIKKDIHVIPNFIRELTRIFKIPISHVIVL